MCFFLVFFFKQKTAYEMRSSDWSSDVCSSDLHHHAAKPPPLLPRAAELRRHHGQHRRLARPHRRRPQPHRARQAGRARQGALQPLGLRLSRAIAAGARSAAVAATSILGPLHFIQYCDKYCRTWLTERKNLLCFYLSNPHHLLHHSLTKRHPVPNNPSGEESVI